MGILLFSFFIKHYSLYVVVVVSNYIETALITCVKRQIYASGKRVVLGSFPGTCVMECLSGFKISYHKTLLSKMIIAAIFKKRTLFDVEHLMRRVG